MRIVKLDENTRSQALARLIGRGASGYGEYEKTVQDIIADTTLLRTTILKSIKQTYDYSEDDLFIPENGLLPLPTQFYFKDNVLHAAYQVYDIASYAQGAIDAPIYPYMLKPEEMKRLFTPYGLELIDYTE